MVNFLELLLARQGGVDRPPQQQSPQGDSRDYYPFWRPQPMTRPPIESGGEGMTRPPQFDFMSMLQQMRQARMGGGIPAGIVGQRPPGTQFGGGGGAQGQVRPNPLVEMMLPRQGGVTRPPQQQYGSSGNQRVGAGPRGGQTAQRRPAVSSSNNSRQTMGMRG